jgi:hydroxymethylpyrimidine pyrophosphatase-like HAD family hydrolase
MKIFGDKSTCPIIAIDFDGTITKKIEYPALHTKHNIYKYAKQVINSMHEVGIAVIIYTCREFVRSTGGLNPQAEMIKWLDANNINYTDINSSIEYAKWNYESRKIYAHMYVDDRAFGWNRINDPYNIWIYIWHDFMNILRVDTSIILKSIDELNSKSKIIHKDTITTIKKHIKGLIDEHGY